MLKELVTIKETESPGIQTLQSIVGMPKIGKEIGTWRRVFTKDDMHPFDEVEWMKYDAVIKNRDGEVKFQQKDVEFPIGWNQTNINIVASKYFRNIDGVKETSFKQIITRVVAVLTGWAEDQQYFNTPNDVQIYKDELTYALLHQYGAFNSPVWFNLGVPGRRQMASACFIQGVEDSLDSIQRFQRSELDIFASGSGSGANLSAIRSSYEKLSSGAYVSGPLAWMRGLDQNAGAMKSGGSTRNAAKMVILNMDHPDILETLDGRPGFIRCKAVEEQRAHDLINVGYGVDYDDPNSAYKNVMYQNANHSVSIPDSYMNALLNDANWETKERLSDKTVISYSARSLWDEISKAAWMCGDPGVQFTDTINKWHTTPNYGRINASNPCAEFTCSDNTACNLCAINLTKFLNKTVFDVESYQHVIRIFVTAQNAIVNKAEYPTEEITKNSHNLRPIGLNYGNLGSLIMKLGYSYDSDDGRVVAARLASLMTGYAYLISSKLAARTNAFPEFERNKNEMLRVMRLHKEADHDVLQRWNLNSEPLDINELDFGQLTQKVWKQVIELGDKYGFLNSQTTLQAPLGTIGFLMGMDTTGIEPAFSLISYKSLVGGGVEKLVNQSVRESLVNLQYSAEEVDNICEFVELHNFIAPASGLKAAHESIFDCAVPMQENGRCLSPMAHLKMMAAIQPLITCAMSKTVNLPGNITPEEIGDVYLESWKLGLKCVALYRDGCKWSQPLSTKEQKTEEPIKEITKRKVMPDDIQAHRHRFVIGGFKGYLIIGEYPDGAPGEVFVKFGKNGSTMGGLIDGYTQLLSIALQYGIPLDKLINSFKHTKFEPSGFTQNPNIRFADSLFDYLFKYLDIRYYGGENCGLDQRINKPKAINIEIEKDDDEEVSRPSLTPDAPPCSNCGSITRRNGACYLCEVCGSTSGCS